MAFAVCVTFQIEDGLMTAFLPLMETNARTSLAKEPGCLQFDVLTDPDLPDTVFLYEIYTTESAFGMHLDTAHFKDFEQVTASMIAAKTVQTFRSVRQ